MKNNRKELADSLKASLSALFDQELFSYSFSRKINSLVYCRQGKDVSQKLIFYLALNPKYATGAIAHVILRIMLYYPDVNNLALEMVGNDHNLLEFSNELTLNIPFHFIIPREEKIEWYIFDTSDFFRVGKKINKLIVNYGIPFMNDYDSIEKLLERYEKNDERPAINSHWYLFIAAAYVLKGDKKSALNVLETKLGQKLNRVKYASAFEYLGA